MREDFGQCKELFNSGGFKFYLLEINKEHLKYDLHHTLLTISVGHVVSFTILIDKVKL